MLAAGPFGLGPLELGLLVLVLIMVFGATRLADIGGSLGKGIKEFRKNVRDEEDETSDGTEAAAEPKAAVTSEPAAEAATEPASAVRCSSCGTLNPVGSKHCNECGTAIVAPVT